MKKVIIAFLVVLPLFAISQKKKSTNSKRPVVKGISCTENDVFGKQIEKDIKTFQINLNKEYRNKKESPLRGDNFTNFKAHPFFPIDLKYRITAKFVRVENPEPFELSTSSGKSKKYQEFGKAYFKLDGKDFVLNIYQSLDLMKTEKYKDHLFLPFGDLTNNKETYGGGKYIDLTIPKGDFIVIDFNQSYHPYCAYNAYDYNCPIVPAENKLAVEIKAGVMYEDVYHH